MLAATLVAMLASSPGLELKERELLEAQASRPAASWYIPAAATAEVGIVTMGIGLGLWALSFSGTCAPVGCHVGLGDVGGGVMLAGFVVWAIGTGWTLALAVMRGGAKAQRIDRLETERDALESQEQYSETELRQRRIALLERDRRGFALPVAMMGFGGALTVGGAVIAATGGDSRAVAGGVLLGFVGGGLGSLGVWLLQSRRDGSAFIDGEIRRQQQATPAPLPIESRLPAAPVFAAYAWAY